jgi:predicted hydrocarbon binding protein
LKGNPAARPDYFRTDVAKGVTRTAAGVRICTLPTEFLLGFRDALVYECGKAYRRVMKTAGKKWGAKLATRFEKEVASLYQTKLRDLPAGLVHVCLTESFAAHGYGNLSVDLSACADGLILVDLTNSMMPSLIRESARPVDLLMAGLLGAVFSHLSGEPLDAVQTDCPSMGAERSRFVIARADAISSVEDWLDTVENHPPHDAIVQRVREHLN